MKKLITTSKRLEKAKNWSMKELEKENNFLYVGDVVMWAGAWGHEPYKKAKVEQITVVAVSYTHQTQPTNREV